MTVDLWILLATLGLQWALIMLPANVGIVNNGLMWAFGNRDDDDEAVKADAPWVSRARRADRNLAENLPIFIALVLVAHVAGKADATTALGAQIFLGARVVHALVYIAGVNVVRTLVWGVSIAGMGLIVSRIVA